MVEYLESSQLNRWLMDERELELCRRAANVAARKYLCSSDGYNVNRSNAAAGAAAEQQQQSQPQPQQQQQQLPVLYFACHPHERRQKFLELQQQQQQQQQDEPQHPQSSSPGGHPFLTPREEAVLVSFYASKLPALVGPAAQLHRLRRDSKVLATATMLFRRFFLSNSVQLHDPKTVMVAAAFLATKIEDSMCDARYLQDATAALQAPVAVSEIVAAEVALLQGVDFYLLCFHPYKAVLALTEDLRTFFKTEKGKNLLNSSNNNTANSNNSNHSNAVTSSDLAPVYEAARAILNDAVVSDIPLQYSPGQIGLAALTVAVERVCQSQPNAPRIDIAGYLRVRFPNEHNSETATDTDDDTTVARQLEELAAKLRELPQGRHGCGTYHTDLAELKGIHKKLKKVRAWGEKGGGGGTKRKGGGGNKKRDKGGSKRSKQDDDVDDGGEPKAKRTKVE